MYTYRSHAGYILHQSHTALWAPMSAGAAAGGAAAVDGEPLQKLLADVAAGRVKPEDAAQQLGQQAVEGGQEPVGDYAAVDLMR